MKYLKVVSLLLIDVVIAKAIKEQHIRFIFDKEILSVRLFLIVFLRSSFRLNCVSNIRFASKNALL